MKKTIEKVKAARIYLKCKTVEQAKFEEVGFQHLQKIPEAFAELKEQTYLVFDKTKHVTDKSFRKTPDLIVIDGGKGQLSSAQKAMKKYELTIPMISLAKREEEIFRPDRPDPILLEANDPILHMLQHIRDESHRFAITYHQKLRLKATTSSILDTIPGIGESTRIKLLQKFGSVEGIKNATLDELGAEVGKKNAIVLKQKL
jgi:excinuclease ABC subunit C